MSTSNRYGTLWHSGFSHVVYEKVRDMGHGNSTAQALLFVIGSNAQSE